LRAYPTGHGGCDFALYSNCGSESPISIHGIFSATPAIMDKFAEGARLAGIPEQAAGDGSFEQNALVGFAVAAVRG
jgi:hypothetical protein